MYIHIYKNEVSDFLYRLVITIYIGAGYLIEDNKRLVQVNSLVTSV